MSSRMTHLKSHRPQGRAALLLCSLMLGSLTHAEASPSVQMHRVGGGTLSADGWTEAASTLGNFSVRLPCLFNDFRMTPASGEVVMADGVGCPAGAIRLSAVRAHYRDEATASKYFENIATAEKEPGAQIERSTQDGHATVTLRNETDAMCAQARTVRAGASNILLIVEGPRSQCDDIKASATPFLASLKLGIGEVAAVPVPTSLPECPLQLELADGPVQSAFNALPHDAIDQTEEQKCQPATVMTVTIRRQGICRIGDTTMSMASLVTRKDTGAPIELTFGTWYGPDKDAALKAFLESQHARQPISVYARPTSITHDVTTVVRQPGGTLLSLIRPSPGSQGTTFSTVTQLAPANLELVRNLDTCH